MHESKLTYNGQAQIEYLVQGSGPSMVILPSLGRGAHDYDELCDLLQTHGIRTLRPQPRGIGASKGPMTNLTMEDLARDVAAVVRAEGLGPLPIAGHAFGNFVARMLATVCPEVVRAVAMVAGSAGKTVTGESPYDDKVSEAVYGSGDLSLPEAKRLEYLQLAFFAPGNDPSSWLTGWYPETKAAQRDAQRRTPIEVYIGAGNAPIFELQAHDDTVADRRYAHTMRTLYGDRVTSAVVNNAGHALVPEQPAETARLLAAWAKSWN